jgi:hypothetical protein
VEGKLKGGTSLKGLYHTVRLEHSKEAQALVKQVVKRNFELRNQEILLSNQHGPVASEFGTAFGPLVQAVNTIKLTATRTATEGYQTIILYSNGQAAHKGGSKGGEKAVKMRSKMIPQAVAKAVVKTVKTSTLKMSPQSNSLD